MDARPVVLNAGFASLPPPWSIDEYNDACFIARDANGQALAYVYFEEETGRRMAMHRLTRGLRQISTSLCYLSRRFLYV